MKRLFVVCFLGLLPLSFVAAQDASHYELFAGGSYLRIHTGGGELTQLVNIPSIQYQPHNLNFNVYGWEGTLIENVNQWLGGEVDVAGFNGSPEAHFLYPASQLLSPSPNFFSARAGERAHLQGDVRAALQLAEAGLAGAVCALTGWRCEYAYQKDRSSTQYHNWLTPEQFGARFGANESDLRKVAAWLENAGFANVEIARSRTFVRMTGTASQVNTQFGLAIQQYRRFSML